MLLIRNQSPKILEPPMTAGSVKCRMKLKCYVIVIVIFKQGVHSETDFQWSPEQTYNRHIQ